ADDPARVVTAWAAHLASFSARSSVSRTRRMPQLSLLPGRQSGFLEGYGEARVAAELAPHLDRAVLVTAPREQGRQADMMGARWERAAVNDGGALAEVASPFGRGDDQGARPVGLYVAVEHAQRLGDVARGVMVRDGHLPRITAFGLRSACARSDRPGRARRAPARRRRAAGRRRRAWRSV